ncbi:hypothetical protein BDR07DRAFT_1461932 [Suillus spraguei]|nr:hypothetical protein BDR07DRAFT_1461932 [Suillus spraguei]
MAPNSTEVMWGPGFIGYMIATALYGISFGQYVFYMLSFPQDSKRLKLFVTTVFLFDTINQFSLMAVYWSILISCRRSISLQCTTETPLQMSLGAFTTYWIVLFVQFFYASRVWIITGNNHWITGLICIFATASFVIGSLGLYTRNSEVMFATKWIPISSSASALCDVVITGSIWLFMRPARTGNVRRKSRNYISDMMWIFINTGLFSCIVAITVTVLRSRPLQYMLQDGQFYTAAPGAVLGRCHLYELDDDGLAKALNRWSGSMLGSPSANGNSLATI